MPDPNYGDMTEEELQAALLRGEGLIVTEDEPEASEPEPAKEEAAKEEPEKEAPAKEEKEEIVVKEKTEKEVSEKKEEPVKAPDVGDLAAQVEFLTLTIEEQKLRQQQVEARAERERFLRDRNAGEAGYWKKRAEARRGAKAEESEDDGEGPVREIPEDDRTAELHERLDALQSEQNRMMLEREYTAFRTRHGDAAEHAPEIKKFIKATVADPDVAEALNGRDMKLARVTIRSVLEQAYLQAKIAPIADKRKQLEERRASQIAGLDEAKKKAAPSSAGATAPAKQKPKKTEDMTAEEANEELHKLYGGLSGNRR